MLSLRDFSIAFFCVSLAVQAVATPNAPELHKTEQPQAAPVDPAAEFSQIDPLFAPAPQTMEIKNAAIKGFKEWKSDKVQDALSQVTRLRTEIEREKAKALNQATAAAFHEVMKGEKPAVAGTVAHPMTSTAKLEGQLKQAHFSLEIAKELAVTDYFALYLSQFPDKKRAFVEAAAKLAPDEMAELMSAYERSINSGSGAEKSPKIVRPASASLLEGTLTK